jgi:hypothetical protein
LPLVYGNPHGKFATDDDLCQLEKRKRTAGSMREWKE